MSGLDGASKGVLAAASLGFVGWAGYTLWNCYKSEGSISFEGLVKCGVKGSANLIGDLGKDLGGDAWDLTRKGGKEGWKLLRKGGNEFKDHVINPAGKWAKRAEKDTEHWVKGAAHSTKKWVQHAPLAAVKGTKKLVVDGEIKLAKKAGKSIKKAFSKKSMKRAFKKLF